MTEPRRDTTPDASPPRGNVRRKLAIALLLVVALGVVAWLFGDRLSLDALARHEKDLRALQQAHPLGVALAALAIFVACTTVTLPGVPSTLGLLYGWLLGFGWGVPVVSFGSAISATLALLLSRYLIRDAIVARFGKQLAALHRMMADDEKLYLLALRLMPPTPFFILNAMMGLSSMRVGTYWRITQLGMLPGTCIFLYAASTVPTLDELRERGPSGIVSPNLVIAMCAIAMAPVVFKKLIDRWRRQRTAA